MKSSVSVGIWGCGFVGAAVFNGFKYYTNVKVYDKYKEGFDSLEDTAAQDVLFVCVPTPPRKDGSCDISKVLDTMEVLSSSVQARTGKPIVIKSTIPPNLCSEIAAKYDNLEIIHSPEFLTERIARLDLLTQAHNAHVILGCGKELSPQVRKLYSQCYPNAQLVECNWNEAALIKYGLNCFFATKISFMNELAQICSKYGANPKKVLGIMKKDDRISSYHMDVPGHDGKQGWGGACFPKDMESLCNIAKEVGVEPLMLLAAIAKNSEVRSD